MIADIPTPRTDGKAFAILWIHDTRKIVVDVEFARDLERDLHLAKLALKEAFEERIIVMSVEQYRERTNLNPPIL